MVAFISQPAWLTELSQGTTKRKDKVMTTTSKTTATKTTTTPQNFKPQRVKLDEFQLFDGNWGGCIKCGEVVEVEPDARADRCESCGTPTVFGSAELSLMNLIEVAE